MFRAREITHPEVARDLLDKFYEPLKDVADQERTPAHEGRFMTMVLDPTKKNRTTAQLRDRERDKKAAAEQQEPEPAPAAVEG
jgi:translation initiation factor IF-3